MFSKKEIGIQKFILHVIGLILEYGAACGDPSREGHINALERVQTKAAQFTNHTKDSELGNVGSA